MPLYADDPDVHVRDEITNADGDLLDFTPVVVADTDTEIAATWEGAPAATRVLKTPLTGLTAGRTHTLRLKVPGGNDLPLDPVFLR